MELKNKDIAEGMYVTNGKQVWKVLDWNSKYTDCLLQKIDKNGNKTDSFVVAENYELYGDVENPQILWMNGDYCIEKRVIDAEQYFVDFYKNNKMFKESKFTESVKPINEKNVQKFVDDLNRICHDEFDDELFTSKYGNLYDFRIQYVGDVPNNWLIYDYHGTSDWFEDKLAKKVVEKLLKQNGWYGEPCSHYSEFCVDIL